MPELSRRERQKVDSRPVGTFYAQPRYVTHVDEAFCARLTELYADLLDDGDAVFDAIKTAFLTSGTVALAVLDQKVGISGAQGPLGDFSITNFSRNEALEEAIVADVTAKLAVFVEWHEVA